MSCNQDKDYASNLQEQNDEILALQSIYNTDDDENFKVLSEETEDGSDLSTVMATVRVRPVSDLVTVNIMVPEKEEEIQGAAAASDVPMLPHNVQLQRTMSGSRWTGSFQVKYLSPILLYITFPKSYPSTEPPSFHFACGWLSVEQIKSLSAVLNQLWLDGCSMPIVYTWIDWLEHNALDHLAISDQLTLQFQDFHQVDGESQDERMDDIEQELGEIIAIMIQHNREQMDIEFCQTSHECEVCYDERPGTNFFRINECNHKFCHECMMAYCQFHVNQGTVEELRCPDTKCNNLLPPYICQAVLDPVAYGKWEKLLLQKTLDSMTDTVYCPRCQSLVIAEEEDLHLAHCTVCFFSFCTECNKVWHQGSNCAAEDDIQEVVGRMTRNASHLSQAEQRKLDEMVRKIQEEAASKVEIRSNMKTCPGCKVKVQKIGGCNKMTCKCSTIFCWVCGKKIEGYSHFRSGSCVLFPGQAGPPLIIGDIRQPPRAVLEMRARIAVNPELRNKECRCPGCKQNNLKMGSNNHVKCWNCKTNFCFLCRQRIMKNVTHHFKGPCQQHS